MLCLLDDAVQWLRASIEPIHVVPNHHTHAFKVPESGRVIKSQQINDLGFQSGRSGNEEKVLNIVQRRALKTGHLVAVFCKGVGEISTVCLQDFEGNKVIITIVFGNVASLLVCDMCDVNSLGIGNSNHGINLSDGVVAFGTHTLPS